MPTPMAPIIIDVSTFLAIFAGWFLSTLMESVSWQNWTRCPILVISGPIRAQPHLDLGIDACVTLMPEMLRINGRCSLFDCLYDASHPPVRGTFRVFLQIVTGWWLVSFYLRSTNGILPADLPHGIAHSRVLACHLLTPKQAY